MPKRATIDAFFGAAQKRPKTTTTTASSQQVRLMCYDHHQFGPVDDGPLTHMNTEDCQTRLSKEGRLVLQNRKEIVRMTSRTACRTPMQRRATAAPQQHRSRRCGAQPLRAAQPLQAPPPLKPPQSQRPMWQRQQEVDHRQSQSQQIIQMRGTPGTQRRRRRRSCWQSGTRTRPGAGLFTYRTIFVAPAPRSKAHAVCCR